MPLYHRSGFGQVGIRKDYYKKRERGNDRRRVMASRDREWYAIEKKRYCGIEFNRSETSERLLGTAR